MTKYSPDYWMNQAILLASDEIYSCTPNPRVGCVIVKNSVIIGAGKHEKPGHEHAEINAINDALKKDNDLIGSTLYVSLEPCSHTGKTPPCASALIKHKITEVYIAMLDPNPNVSGNGVAMLEKSGIKVTLMPHFADEAKNINLGFIKKMTHGMPYIRLKSAMSIDGKVAMSSGESKWITGTEARLDVQKLRAQSCAIITGIGTILADDPSMNVRDLGGAKILRQPELIIFDSQLKLPLTANILTTGVKVTVITLSSDSDKITALKLKNVKVVVQTNTSKEVSITKAIDYLAQQNFNEILIEAGAKLSTSFLKSNYIDQFIVYVGAKILGIKAISAFNLEIDHLDDAITLKLKDLKQLGQSVRYAYDIKKE